VTANARLDLYNMLAKGPVSIVVDASSRSFIFYADGILSSGCSHGINHALTATAYGYHPYFWFWRNHYVEAENSWGAEWGNNGYVKISSNSRSGNGMCGIYIYAAIPFIEKQ
jgi:cathepsin L